MQKLNMEPKTTMSEDVRVKEKHCKVKVYQVEIYVYQLTL